MKNAFLFLLCVSMNLFATEHQLVNVETTYSSIVLDIRYATEDNFLGYAISVVVIDFINNHRAHRDHRDMREFLCCLALNPIHELALVT